MFEAAETAQIQLWEVETGKTLPLCDTKIERQEQADSIQRPSTLPPGWGNFGIVH
jgi:hypothetical protein